jgi:hypothetical protein
MKLQNRRKKWTTATLGLPILIALGLLLAGIYTTPADANSEAPGAPSNLQGTNASDGLRLSWTAPSTGTVTGYQVLRRRPEEGEKNLAVYVNDTSSTDTSWTDTSVSDGVKYVYRVKARNGDAVGPKSNFVNMRYVRPEQTSSEPEPEPTEEPTPTPEPTSALEAPTLTLTVKSHSIDLSWEAPDDDHNATGFTVMRRVEGEGNLKEIAALSAESTSYSDTNVKDATAYEYRVDVTSDDQTAQSNVAKATYVEPIPEAPRNLQTRSLDEGIQLSWEATAGNVTGYRILRKRPLECESALTVHVSDTGDDSTNWTDTDVEPGFTYVYRVKAISSKGAGASSSFNKVQYSPPNSVVYADAPSAPRNLDARSIPQGIVLSWDPPANDDGISGYQVLRRRPENCEGALRIYVPDTGTSTTTYVDDDVEVGVQYVYRIRAINDHGAGKESRFYKHRKQPPTIVIYSLTDFNEIRPGQSLSIRAAVVGMLWDADESTQDYTLTGNVVVKSTKDDEDACEGDNLGSPITWNVIDANTEYADLWFGGPNCPAGEYTVVWEITYEHTSEVYDFTSNSTYTVKE